MSRVRSFLAAAWRPIREHARKLVPSRAVRWTLLYVPGFTATLLFAIQAIGGMDDLFAYVIEVGTRSLPVLVAIAITYGLASGLGWNLDNDYRTALQQHLDAGWVDAKWPLSGSQLGAFLILAGEMLSILLLLALVLVAMLVWQG